MALDSSIALLLKSLHLALIKKKINIIISDSHNQNHTPLWSLPVERKATFLIGETYIMK
jgi:hypothetical protein